MLNKSEGCPICGYAGYEATALTVDLTNALKRWERELSIVFPPFIWQQYSQFFDRPLTLFKCQRCCFGCFEPVVAGSAEFYRAISANNYYNSVKWEFLVAANDLSEMGAHKILDVGCGSGGFLDFLRAKKNGYDLYGYDLNAELVEELSSKGYSMIPIDQSQFKEVLCEDGLFDAICMLQVLEHTDDPIGFVRSFTRWLKPGGSLIISTPDANGPIKNFPDALTEIPPHHVTQWTVDTMKAMMGQLNFSVFAIQHEPLPDFLWDSYLPVLWDDAIWPVQLFDSLAKSRGLISVGERAGFAASLMRDMGIKWLHGVPGHTLYVHAINNDAGE